MIIKILYVDVRKHPSLLAKHQVLGHRGITARQALYLALDRAIADQIVQDLSRNSQEIVVSWSSLSTYEHSDVGGVDSLDWEIPDNSIISIVYEGNETSKEALDASIEWMTNAIKG